MGVGGGGGEVFIPLAHGLQGCYLVITFCNVHTLVGWVDATALFTTGGTPRFSSGDKLWNVQ